MSQKNSDETRGFQTLFLAACSRCFGRRQEKTLSEPEARHMSLEIGEKTGLVIGWKSLKNYAAALPGDSGDKKINPSPATRDTLARYVMGAPATTEILRKRDEPSFSYWYRFMEEFLHTSENDPGIRKMHTGSARNRSVLRIIGILLVMSLMLLIFLSPGRGFRGREISDDFSDLDNRGLAGRGWFLIREDRPYWERRGELNGGLTLFTLQGDNWPENDRVTGIRNMLARKAPRGSFSAEVHFSDFIPSAKWQQAGMILMEDTTFNGRMIRLSLAYNDFFGGLKKPAEVLVQVIASGGKNNHSVEEVAHHTIFTCDSVTGESFISDNMTYSALRIEKMKNTLRVLYAASPVENFSLKEIIVFESQIDPEFIGIFALKGFEEYTPVIPVHISFFSLSKP